MSKRNKQKRPPVWVSQNFLTSGRVIQRIVRMADIKASDHVIEIGSGKGHITKELVKYAAQVSAIEIDKTLYDRLHVKFKDEVNIRLHHCDFLKWTLPASGSYKVFANIPFCHTTEILDKLTKSNNPPQEMWLIIEKGAAKRFMGQPRENQHSLMIKPKYDMRIAYYFRREDFHPLPGVDVVMVHISKKSVCDIPKKEWRDYQRFVFITNAGKAGLLSMFTKRQLSMACKSAGLNLNDLLSGEILYTQWLCLFRCFCKYVKR